MNPKHQASHIESFTAGGAIYRHVIFCSDDDRVEMQDDSGKTILTFTSDCEVHDELSGQIGTFHMRGDDHHWDYKQIGQGTITFGQDLLKAEVEVSKLYLAAMVNP